ncbi:MAG: diguanylate cyclase [Acidobacteria bacterium]|nr:diguanylate cyclase [Acidobacteriota bacterium]
MPEVELHGAQVLAERLRTSVTQIHLDGSDQGTTVSIGVAAFPDHGSEGAELLEAADRALYRAKHAGRNRIELASPLHSVA